MEIMESSLRDKVVKYGDGIILHMGMIVWEYGGYITGFLCSCIFFLLSPSLLSRYPTRNLFYYAGTFMLPVYFHSLVYTYFPSRYPCLTLRYTLRLNHFLFFGV